jgi:hypothetical protein
MNYPKHIQKILDRLNMDIAFNSDNNINSGYVDIMKDTRFRIIHEFMCPGHYGKNLAYNIQGEKIA